MSRIFWDTNLFIYLIQDAGPLGEQVGQLRERMLARGDGLFTSTLTLGEVLVKPLEAGREDLRDRYEDALRTGATLLAFDVGAARRYAAIRSDRSIRAPDAVQLACAAEARMNLFITNDERLSRKAISGIDFIAPLARALI
ncbi:MAG: PilT protein domain protein [Chloroflexi bacterium]|nr:PilT protein domain protein [Chloroflexota bacterium]